MPLMPAATKKLIRPGASDPRINARIGILHVDAGNAESLFGWFNGPSGGIESHGFVKKSGVIEQYRDTDWQADANFQANDFATSWETQGFGTGEWTDEQIASIKRIMLWEKKADGIPLRVVTSWNDPQGGWGYHTMFPQWSNVKGKTCPGPQRIQQFKTVLVPWINAGGTVERKDKTPHITEALEAKTVEDRRKALRLVVNRGSDEAAQVAAKWLQAIDAAADAREAATALRVDLRDLRIVV